MEFEKVGYASVWLSQSLDEGDEQVDVMKEFCGVDYYDLDFQEFSASEDGALIDVANLVSQVSYGDSFAKATAEAAREKGIQTARWVMVQLDFAYDPTRVQKNVASDPVFVGAFPYEED